MPTEIRHVIFGTTEILEAAVAFFRAAGRKLPAGTVAGLDLIDDDVDGKPGGPSDLCVSLDLIQDKDGTRLKLPLDRQELFAALIGYCQARSIPLPAAAEKVIQIIKGKIVLVITMNLDFEKRQIVEDLRIGA